MKTYAKNIKKQIDFPLFCDGQSLNDLSFNRSLELYGT